MPYSYWQKFIFLIFCRYHIKTLVKFDAIVLIVLFSLANSNEILLLGSIYRIFEANKKYITNFKSFKFI